MTNNSPPASLCFYLYASARRMVQRYTAALKPHNLTYTQYIVLKTLAESDDITVSELGERLFLDTGTLTPVLKKLEERTLLNRTRQKSDERVVLLAITSEGRELAKEIAPDVEGLCGCCGLEPDERETVSKLLAKMLQNFSCK